MTMTEIAIPGVIASKKKTAKKKAAVPATEIPGWAKRAALRNTPAEMAAVPNAVPAPAPSSELPAPEKVSTAKPKKPSKRTAKSLGAIGAAWIESIRAAGHSDSTVSSYRNDLEVAYEHLGGDVDPAAITAAQIEAFNKCKAVMKKRNGKPKAMPTILKTRRALRLALTWASEQGLIAKAPYAAD